MKKLKQLFTLAVMMVIAQASFGQAQLALGLKAGLNFANVNASAPPLTTFDSRTGYHVGAFLSVKLTKFAIQPEVIFSQQGSTVKISGTSIDSNFGYVNIPVILKYYIAGGFNLQAGPQFGFLTSATGPVYNTLTSAYASGDIKSTLKGSDISVGLGAGFDLPFKLSIDARYNLGISEVNDGGSATKNQVFQFSLGYKLIKLGN